MSIFGKIMSTIFGGSAHAAPATAPDAASAGTPGATAGTSASPATTPMSAVDVGAVLDKLAGASKEKLDWRRSIVDLMKLVGMESSLPERRELAKELGYTGDTKDTATMNIWLHKQVMAKLAANGGQVPKELLN